MTKTSDSDRGATSVEIGDYCRRIEAHLTQVNRGHLVRIVGPGFDLVRRWAGDGVPPSIVMRGIERKAERHRHGRATRPLRIEFCEADVREVLDEWRRAIGVPKEADAAESPSSRKTSLPKHIDRAMKKLDGLTGRLDLPEPLRDGVEACRERLSALKETAVGARGEARDEVVARLAELDRELLVLGRDAMPDEWRREVEREAEADLLPYRDRLSPALWQQSVGVTVARLVRDRLGLPTLELPA